MRLISAGSCVILLALLTGCASPPSVNLSAKVSAASPPATVRYQLRMEDLKYNFGTFPPVAEAHSGDIIETKTVDSDGKAIVAAGHKAMGFNALTGPFLIREAEPGDTLAIRFLSIDVDGNEGYGDIDPAFGGAINSNSYTPMLGTPIKTQSWTYPIDHTTNTATFKAKDSSFSVKIPLHPFMGCVGVAPANGESRSSIVPAEFGGNMDAQEASVGNTIYLPVNVRGALLFMGDGHGAMGDGEIAGTAVEVSTKARFQVTVIKHKTIHWPRFENNDYIMAAGIYRPLDDALRIAFTELVHWIHEDYGLSEQDAYELLSKTAEIHVAEMVDPNYVVIAKINRRFLPHAVKPS